MEQQNSMQPQMNMQGPENGQYVPGYDTQSNMSPYNVQQMQFGETQQQKDRRAEIFSIMAIPTCIYAGLYTVLLYNNYQLGFSASFSGSAFIRFFCTTIIKVLRCRFLL